jgi:hypothetical protein
MSSCVRLRGRCLVPQSFKMALPSTTQELSPNSVQGKQPELGIDEINEWPALS